MRRVVVTGLGMVSPLSSTAMVLGRKFWTVVPELTKLLVLIQMDILLIMLRNKFGDGVKIPLIQTIGWSLKIKEK